MYCVFLGKAVQTVNPPNGSVGTAQLADGQVTNAKLQNSSITLNGSAISLGGSATVGGTNTPAFQARSNSGQSISNATHTDLVFGEEIFDTDNAFASNVFTVPSGKGGKYFLYAQAGRQNWDSDRFLCYMARTRSGVTADLSASESAINTTAYHTTNTLCIADLEAGDVVKVIVYHNSGSTRTLSVGDRTTFQGFKLL